MSSYKVYYSKLKFYIIKTDVNTLSTLTEHKIISKGYNPSLSPYIFYLYSDGVNPNYFYVNNIVFERLKSDRYACSIIDYLSLDGTLVEFRSTKNALRLIIDVPSDEVRNNLFDEGIDKVSIENFYPNESSVLMPVDQNSDFVKLCVFSQTLITDKYFKLVLTSLPDNCIKRIPKCIYTNNLNKKYKIKKKNKLLEVDQNALNLFKTGNLHIMRSMFWSAEILYDPTSVCYKDNNWFINYGKELKKETQLIGACSSKLITRRHKLATCFYESLKSSWREQTSVFKSIQENKDDYEMIRSKTRKLLNNSGPLGDCYLISYGKYHPWNHVSKVYIPGSIIANSQMFAAYSASGLYNDNNSYIMKDIMKVIIFSSLNYQLSPAKPNILNVMNLNVENYMEDQILKNKCINLTSNEYSKLNFDEEFISKLLIYQSCMDGAIKQSNQINNDVFISKNSEVDKQIVQMWVDKVVKISKNKMNELIESVNYKTPEIIVPDQLQFYVLKAYEEVGVPPEFAMTNFTQDCLAMIDVVYFNKVKKYLNKLVKDIKMDKHSKYLLSHCVVHQLYFQFLEKSQDAELRRIEQLLKNKSTKGNTISKVKKMDLKKQLELFKVYCLHVVTNHSFVIQFPYSLSDTSAIKTTSIETNFKFDDGLKLNPNDLLDIPMITITPAEIVLKTDITQFKFNDNYKFRLILGVNIDILITEPDEIITLEKTTNTIMTDGYKFRIKLKSNKEINSHNNNDLCFTTDIIRIVIFSCLNYQLSPAKPSVLDVINLNTKNYMKDEILKNKCINLTSNKYNKLGFKEEFISELLIYQSCLDGVMRQSNQINNDVLFNKHIKANKDVVQMWKNEIIKISRDEINKLIKSINYESPQIIVPNQLQFYVLEAYKEVGPPPEFIMANLTQDCSVMIDVIYYNKVKKFLNNLIKDIKMEKYSRYLLLHCIIHQLYFQFMRENKNMELQRIEHLLKNKSIKGNTMSKIKKINLNEQLNLFEIYCSYIVTNHSFVIQFPAEIGFGFDSIKLRADDMNIPVIQITPAEIALEITNTQLKINDNYNFRIILGVDIDIVITKPDQTVTFGKAINTIMTDGYKFKLRLETKKEIRTEIIKTSWIWWKKLVYESGKLRIEKGFKSYNSNKKIHIMKNLNNRFFFISNDIFCSRYTINDFPKQRGNLMIFSSYNMVDVFFIDVVNVNVFYTK